MATSIAKTRKVKLIEALRRSSPHPLRFGDLLAELAQEGVSKQLLQSYLRDLSSLGLVVSSKQDTDLRRGYYRWVASSASETGATTEKGEAPPRGVFDKRMGVHSVAKQTVGRRVAEIVLKTGAGLAVFDAGTSCLRAYKAMLELGQGTELPNVLTPSIAILASTPSGQANTVYSLGSQLSPGYQCLLWSPGIDGIPPCGLSSDVAVIGAGSIDDCGARSSDIPQHPLRKALMENCKGVLVFTLDHTKLGSRGKPPFLEWSTLPKLPWQQTVLCSDSWDSPEGDDYGAILTATFAKLGFVESARSDDCLTLQNKCEKREIRIETCR